MGTSELQKYAAEHLRTTFVGVKGANADYVREASLKESAYAGSTQGVRVSKRSEAWAENFAAYMDGGKNASKVSDEIKKMIDGYFTESVVKGTGSGIIKAEVNETVARAKKISNSREKSRIINEAINAKIPVFAESI